MPQAAARSTSPGIWQAAAVRPLVGNGVSLVVSDGSAGQASFTDRERHLLGLALGRPHRADFRIAEAPWQTLRMRPGDIQVLPAGTPHEVAWESARFALLAIGRDRAAALAADEDRASEPAARPGLRLRDPLLPELMESVAAELLRDGGPEPLMLDALERLLVLRLARLSGDLADAPDPAILTTRQLALVRRAISDRLAERFRIDELATLLGWSTAHFIRSFRRTVGLTPHQFVIAERLDRARALLLESDLPVSAIAIMTGFSSQSHLTALFSRRYGVPPAAFRRAHR